MAGSPAAAPRYQFVCAQGTGHAPATQTLPKTLQQWALLRSLGPAASLGFTRHAVYIVAACRGIPVLQQRTRFMERPASVLAEQCTFLSLIAVRLLSVGLPR